jgi:hypothetical protein
LLGWGIVMNEAELLAFSDAFARGTPHLPSRRAIGDLEQSMPPMRWEHLEAAFRALLPQIARVVPKTTRVPKDRREGPSMYCTMALQGSAKQEGVRAVLDDASDLKWRLTLSLVTEEQRVRFKQAEERKRSRQALHGKNK